MTLLLLGAGAGSADSVPAGALLDDLGDAITDSDGDTITDDT